MSSPATERLSPENGLLLNALHDRAFDKGLMTIDHDLRIVASRQVQNMVKGGPESDYLRRFHHRQIDVPGRFHPRRELIEYHNDVAFRDRRLTPHAFNYFESTLTKTRMA